MNYIRQIIYEMKHQKMMTWVSVGGTALSIFLVMVFFMSEQVKTVNVSPESNRDRIMVGQYVEIKNNDGGSSSGTFSHDTGKRLYDSIPGVENMTFLTGTDTYTVNVPGKKPIQVNGLYVDQEFWNIYDFKFLSGKPFDKASCEDGEKKVVLSRSVARSLLKDDDVAGNMIQIQHVPYIVCGVVEDVSPLLKTTSADIYLPLGPEQRKPGLYDELMGNLNVRLLLEKGTDPMEIKNEVKRRYSVFSNALKKEGKELGYHGQPYTAEEFTVDIYSNVDPDIAPRKRQKYLIYLVMLLLPAINLSSMTRSRLRHRVSEIGVRRAYGASKGEIIRQILGENFIITIVGGVIGLILSGLFMTLFYDVFFASRYEWGQSLGNSIMDSSNPSLGMLFTWNSFLLALLFCFILNLLSAFIPSWRASRSNPAEAIAKSK